MQAIRCNNLSKKFGGKVVLSGIDIVIPNGAAVGLLGKNGAGKTTLNRILTGLSFASSGEVFIHECAPAHGNNKVAFLSENISIFPTLSAFENLYQIYLINGINPGKNVIQNTLEMVSIENEKKPAGQFSLGMKRRLQIAMSVLVVERDVLILDEPTNGLDINGVVWLRDLLLSFIKRGKTLIITSHAIRELESILSHYAIMSNGKIVSFGKMSDIMETEIVITLNEGEVSKVADMLAKNRIESKIFGNVITIKNNSPDLSQICMTLFLENKVVPIAFSSQEKSLVDLFLSHTGDDNA